jgi:DNA mismatch repair protein MutL
VAGAFRRAMTVAWGTESGTEREQELLTTVACKPAAKLGDRLSKHEREALMKQWFTKSELQATCPHGRSVCYRLHGLHANEIAHKLDRRYGRLQVGRYSQFLAYFSL